MSGNYGSDFVSAKCIADKGTGESIAGNAVGRAQANAHLLLQCCARSTGSAALLFAPASDIRGGRIRPQPSAEPF